MHSMGKTIAELHAMLKLHKKGIPKKVKNKLAYAPKPNPPSAKTDNPAKDSIYHQCKEVGHWRRNYPSYQAKLKKRKETSLASTLGIFTVELYAFPNKTWVYDTGCGTHISSTLQGLIRSKKLKHGALSLYMGNGIRAAVEAIGSFDLILPTRILNMVPTKKVERTPYEIWHGKAPKLSYLSVWGCEETMGYYFYYPPENKIFVAQNAEFFEDNLIVQEASRSHGPLIMSGSDEGLELI
ncbi:hypothetical protein Tco_0698835 [Tanacetum coccineum]